MRLTFPPASVLLAFMLAFVYFSAFGIPLFKEPDVAWHIAAGDYILQHGIPKTDPWAFTSNGVRWYNIAWLWDILLSVLVGWFGLNSLYHITNFWLAFNIGLLAYIMHRRQCAETNAIVGALLPVITVLTMFAIPRPHLGIITLAILAHWALDASREKSPRALFIIPFLVILWVNMHGSFLIVFAMLGMYAIEAVVTHNKRWLKHIVITGICCIIASLINPYGFEILAAVKRTMSTAAQSYISEWQPFNPGTDLGAFILLLAYVFAGDNGYRRIPLADKLLSAALFIAMLFASRYTLFFALFAAPYVAYNFQRLIDLYPEFIDNKGAIDYNAPALRKRFTMATAALLLTTPLWFRLFPISEDPGQYKINAEDVAAFVSEHYPGVHFLNDYDLGGPLIYHARGKIPIFIDGRASTAYPEELMKDYAPFVNAEPGWEKLLTKYNVKGIIIRNNLRFDGLMETGDINASDWLRVFKGSYAQVYLYKPLACDSKAEQNLCE